MAKQSSIITDEVQKFSAAATDWWEKAKGLLRLNNLRVPYARDCILEDSGAPEASRQAPQPLKGFKIIDVGCGAGIFSEALAKLGASVTGLDASAELIAVAREHAKLDPALTSNLKYVSSTSEDHVVDNAAAYDAVVCSEVIEHVDNKPTFVKNLVQLTKPKGTIVITTLNKTWFSRVYCIWYLEYVGRYIPRGTHHYRLFISKEDLEKMLIENGCEIKKVRGLNLKGGEWKWIDSMKYWYAIHATKKAGD